jgi:hypothetical protein
MARLPQGPQSGVQAIDRRMRTLGMNEPSAYAYVKLT